MPARITAHPIAVELLIKLAFAHLLVDDIAEGCHIYILNLSTCLGRGLLARFGDAGELEDGAEIAPVSTLSAFDRGFCPLDQFAFFAVLHWISGRSVAMVLSLLRSWIIFWFRPTAFPVGCILLPLRGWFYVCACRCACGRCIRLRYDGGGWRFALGGGRCFGPADRSVRATRALGLCVGF